MKLGLINPQGTIFFENDSFRNFWDDFYTVDYYKKIWSGMSTALLTVAALTPDYFEIKVIDELFEEIDFDEHFDLVGITAITQQATRAYQVADLFRSHGVYVVMGGIHSTIMPEEAILHCNSVITGEAETTWQQFLDDFCKNRPRRFYGRDNRNAADLTRSPVPRYDLMKRDNYRTIWPQTTRGCPHNCDFCVASNIYGRKYRHKLLDTVLAEIAAIMGIWQFPTISFADDNMFVNRGFSTTLINALQPLKIRWLAQSDISIGEDERFLELLYRNGCEAVYIGLESVTGENLNAIDTSNWKYKKFGRYVELIHNIQSHGIGVHASFMIGFDHDTKDTIHRMIDFIVDNNLFGSSISILSPYPGSRIREQMLKQNRLLANPWSDYNGGHVTFQPRLMSPLELQNGLIEIWKSIYKPEVQQKKRMYFKEIYKSLSRKKIKKEPHNMLQP